VNGKYFLKKIMPKKQILLIGKIICILLKRNNMQTKFRIVETEDYVLAVSDEEIKINDLYYLPRTNNVCKCVNDPTELNLERHLGLLKIIAYLPKGNAPKLDLPLLPEMVVEDDVEKLIEREYPLTGVIGIDARNGLRIEGLKLGYKAATKIFSEDDLRKAIELTLIDAKESVIWSNTYHNHLSDKIIQSLKQPTPKWFVVEMQTTKSEVFRENDNVPYATLKTTTINGKTYLVGKFVNE